MKPARLARPAGLLLLSLAVFLPGCDGAPSRTEWDNANRSPAQTRATAPDHSRDELRQVPQASAARESPPATPESSPQSESHPARPPGGPPSDAQPPRSQPTALPTTQPSTTTTPSPHAPEPLLPPYLTILQKIDPRGAFRADATVTLPSKLTLNTNNVQRLAIDRRKLPFARGRRVALWIDDQGIELSGPRDVIEFVRSRNGDWSATEALKAP